MEEIDKLIPKDGKTAIHLPAEEWRVVNAVALTSGDGRPAKRRLNRSGAIKRIVQEWVSFTGFEVPNHNDPDTLAA